MPLPPDTPPPARNLGHPLFREAAPVVKTLPQPLAQENETTLTPKEAGLLPAGATGWPLPGGEGTQENVALRRNVLGGLGVSQPKNTHQPMEFLKVTGGARLSGSLQPQGAKNEALQIISATLLTDQPVTVHNVPDILDVRRLIEFLANMGAQVERLGPETYRFTCADIDPDYLLTPAARREAQRLRGSIMVLGPLLARFGRAYLSKPGGDKIGRRRVDVHIEGLIALGATTDYEADSEFYKLHAPKGLTGTYMLLEEASVTGTANILMAAALAHGTTTIFNAACEPYIQQLCRLLTQMGAKITGAGSNLLTITGVPSLGGAEHTMLADMIEVGSFIALAAMTQSNLRISNVGTAHLGLIPRTFQKLGVKLEVENDDIMVWGQEPCIIETSMDGGILTLADHTWPGPSPDLLSVLLVTATQCQGTALIHQKMFESRLFFVDKLIDMGAQIILCDPHRATVIGLGRHHNLRGISMTSPDIRAGVALLIAAMSASGTSRIYNIEQIDRGYAHIDRRLNALGAQIERLEE